MIVESSVPAAVDAATLFAKTNGVGTGTCADWVSACTLTRAMSIAQTGDQIWVKAGTYGAIAALPNGVKMIGGFAGTETAVSQSNPTTNVTMIGAGGNQRAVVSQDNSSSTVLRGFKITGGQSGDDWDGGGGMLMVNSSAQVVQCVFENNQATRFGAGVSIRGSGSPLFVNCDFHGNGTGASTSVQPLAGGVVYLYSGSATFTNCLFYNNKSGEGAAIAVVSGTATLVNSTIVNNQATIGYGGGIHDQEGRVIVKNSILWGNSAVKGGTQIFNNPGFTTTVAKSDVQGGWSGTGNIDTDPLFVNPGINDYKLQQTSPCKNTGDNAFLPSDLADLDWDNNLSEAVPKDLAFGQRTIGVMVDMGAYEAPLAGGGGTGLD
jgi:hypothetical protein